MHTSSMHILLHLPSEARTSLLVLGAIGWGLADLQVPLLQAASRECRTLRSPVPSMCIELLVQCIAEHA